MNSCLVNLRNGNPEYQRVANAICDHLGIQRIPVYAADAGNACATMFTQQSPVITYQPGFLDYLSDDAVFFILSHEVGHHYRGHLSNRSHTLSWTQEFEADQVAAAVLYDDGFSLSEAIGAMKESICCEGISRTHPSTSLRIGRIRISYAGFNARNFASDLNWGF